MLSETLAGNPLDTEVHPGYGGGMTNTTDTTTAEHEPRIWHRVTENGRTVWVCCESSESSICPICRQVRLEAALANLRGIGG